MSISEKSKEIKGDVVGAKNIGFDFENPTQRKAFFIAFIFLVAFASFGLGRLSGLETVKKNVEIELPKDQTGRTSQTATVGVAFATTSTSFFDPRKTSGKYVASKNGTKYYMPTCGGVKRISVKNRVWFDTKEEAEKAGYVPASNCKGM